MIHLDFMYFQLFAKVNPFESMGGQFRKGSKSFGVGDVVLWVVVLIVIGLILWLLTRFKERQDGPTRTNSPRGLFRELCRAHGLKFADQWLLSRVARWQRLTHPAKLFLEPERYDAANLSPRLRMRQTRLTKLHDKLFAADG